MWRKHDQELMIICGAKSSLADAAAEVDADCLKAAPLNAQAAAHRVPI